MRFHAYIRPSCDQTNMYENKRDDSMHINVIRGLYELYQKLASVKWNSGSYIGAIELTLNQSQIQPRQCKITR